uniref:Uncharacterized protein n=1 Tax=Arundo donax TaxID=35708 RepID=A0A0A8Z095_ARUDO
MLVCYICDVKTNCWSSWTTLIQNLGSATHRLITYQ